jgi:hypothetical protein
MVPAQSTPTPAPEITIYYVSSTNGNDNNPGTLEEPWRTIQHAADVMLPGETAIVLPGQYGRVILSNSGEPGKFITFRGVARPDMSHADLSCPPYDPKNPVHTPGNPTRNAVMKGFDIVGSASAPMGYIRIENFEITDINANMVFDNVAIRLQYTEHIQVVNNFFHDLNPDEKTGGGAIFSDITLHHPTDVYYNHNILFKGNVVWRVPGQHLNVKGHNWIIEDNELAQGLDSNTKTGAYIAADNDGIRFLGTGHIIRNNYLHDFHDSEMIGNPHIDAFQTFTDNPDTLYAHHILIENNVISNGFHQGFQSSDLAEEFHGRNNLHHITLRNNIFDDIEGYYAAIFYHGYIDDLIFVNNVVSESSYVGSLHHSPRAVVANNIFLHGGAAHYGIGAEDYTMWDYNIYYPDFTRRNPDFDQNSFFGIDPKIQIAEDFKGPDGIWATEDDPPRITYATDSIAIDTGYNLLLLDLYLYEGLNRDVYGVFRPQGEGWDIGAHEFIQH